ncbi:MAG: M16 family metallopeptidase [Verrucomicrobiota bacterium]
MTTYRDTLLPGGLRVVTAAMPHMASAAVGIWVAAGSRHEPAECNGISHFIEHLLFKGTRRRTAAAISEAVEGIGGYLNAFTDEEHTCFYARAHGTRLPDLVDVLLDMFHHARLAPADIRKEREVILEELAMYRDQPADHVHDLLNAAQFPGHPLGRPVIGTPRTLRALNRGRFVAYLASHYVTGSTVIAAAGAVDHDALLHLVRPRLRGARTGPRPPALPVGPPAGRPLLRAERRSAEQMNLALGFRSVSRHDPRREAVRLLNVLLGENMSSRLFQAIRETHGLTYNIHSSMTVWEDVGDLVVSAGLDPSELERTLRLTTRELRRLQDRRVGARELGRARDYVIGQLDLSLENTENQMMWLGEQWIHHGALRPPPVIKDRLARVTPAAIQSVAREILGPGSRTLALVGPDRPPRTLAALLAR